MMAPHFALEDVNVNIQRRISGLEASSLSDLDSHHHIIIVIVIIIINIISGHCETNLGIPANAKIPITAFQQTFCTNLMHNPFHLPFPCLPDIITCERTSGPLIPVAHLCLQLTGHPMISIHQTGCFRG